MSTLPLPKEFVESLAPLGEIARDLPQVLAEAEPSVSVRLNRAKGAEALGGAEAVAWCADGIYLPERPLFAADPRWHQGRYYVQEASSMAHSAAFAELAAMARDAAPLRVLDACAAPGGKTIGILSALTDSDFVVANEYDPHRCRILLENIEKWGAPNVAISRGDARAFARAGEVFDIITADVPCSGEGMMRKEEIAVSQWSPALVAQCAALQRAIVADLWKALRPGGFLLYSTCTFNTSENEENIRWAMDELGAEGVALALADMPGVCPAVLPGVEACRFIPGRVRGEGLFIAALRKPEDGHAAAGSAPRRSRKADKGGKAAAKDPAFDRTLLLGAERYALLPGEVLTAVPAEHRDFVEALARIVRLERAGLPVAELKGRDYAPTCALLLSTTLNGAAIPSISLELAEAYSYLRGNALSDIPTPAKGYAAAAFGGYPLGPAKCVGSRANNLYPAAYRLRLPDSALPSDISQLNIPIR